MLKHKSAYTLLKGYECDYMYTVTLTALLRAFFNARRYLPEAPERSMIRTGASQGEKVASCSVRIAGVKTKLTRLHISFLAWLVKLVLTLSRLRRSGTGRERSQ